MLRCSKCDEIITEARIVHFIESTGNLPDACTACADLGSDKPLTLMAYGHKTGGELVIAKGRENKRLAMRAYRRSR